MNMEKGADISAFLVRPQASRSSSGILICLARDLRYGRTNSIGNSSCPAATGVWVVKTEVRAITSRAVFTSRLYFSINCANRSDIGESAMPFIHVADSRLDAHAGQGAHAADAENDLLGQSDARFAVVQPGCDLTHVPRIFFDIGIEQDQLNATDHDFPYIDQDIAVRTGDFYAQVFAFTVFSPA